MFVIGTRIGADFSRIEVMTLTATDSALKLEILKHLDEGDVAFAQQSLRASLREDQATMRTLQRHGGLRSHWKTVLDSTEEYLAEGWEGWGRSEK